MSEIQRLDFYRNDRLAVPRNVRDGDYVLYADHLASERAAFKKGAEAMRERAADVADVVHDDQDDEAPRKVADEIGEKIRSLPLPEMP